MRPFLENLFDRVVEAPGWLRSVVALLLAAIGVAVFVLCGRLGVHEGGKLGGVLIALGLGLFAVDLFIE